MRQKIHTINCISRWYYAISGSISVSQYCIPYLIVSLTHAYTFRLFSDPHTRAFVTVCNYSHNNSCIFLSTLKDVMEGYYPYELKDRYPDGVCTRAKFCVVYFYLPNIFCRLSFMLSANKMKSSRQPFTNKTRLVRYYSIF